MSPRIRKSCLTPDEIREVVITYRCGGAIGGNQAFLPKVVKEFLSNSPSCADGYTHVLDYGAGKDAPHTFWLRMCSEAYKVTAWDVGVNFVPEIHNATALSRRYDIVFASNVLNIAPGWNALKRILDEVSSLVEIGSGMFFCNYPFSPRRIHLGTNEALREELLLRFNVVEVYSYTSGVWFLCKGTRR